MPSPPPPMLLRNARLAGPTLDAFAPHELDVRLGGGVIVEVGEKLPSRSEEQVHDLGRHLLLPAPAEPHAHLDKAFLAERVVNPDGDLAGAVAAIRAAYAGISASDVTDRAGRALAEAVSKGYTAVRSHVDCGVGIATRSLTALVELRERWTQLVELQLVALAGFPFTGSEGAENRRLLIEAIEHGADVIGGVPALDIDPPGAIRELSRIAADSGLPLDLHIDETTDPTVLTLRELAEAVNHSGLGGRATASHCVSLGQQEPRTRVAVAALLADAGIAVVTLPQTNLYLQGRDAPDMAPRALTALRDLLAAGVTVAAGGDNWRDPFNPLGRIDPMETAALMVTAGHLDVATAFHIVSSGSRRAMGLAQIHIAPGHPADLLAIRATSLNEAVAAASPDRKVWRAGRLVAASRLVRDVLPTPEDPLLARHETADC